MISKHGTLKLIEQTPPPEAPISETHWDEATHIPIVIQHYINQKTPQKKTQTKKKKANVVLQGQRQMTTIKR